jgi:hypothetical protein
MKTFEEYMTTFEYQHFLKDNHSLNDYGLWEILAEDSNPDFAGSHIMPRIAIVEGTFEQAIRYGVSLPEFYTWGSGGSFKKLPEVIKL